MIAIKDMKMPKSCFFCPLRQDDYSIGLHICGGLATLGKDNFVIELKDMRDKRKNNCPLVEVK